MKTLIIAAGVCLAALPAAAGGRSYGGYGRSATPSVQVTNTSYTSLVEQGNAGVVNTAVVVQGPQPDLKSISVLPDLKSATSIGKININKSFNDFNEPLGGGGGGGHGRP